MSKNVCYILEKKNGKFKPFVSSVHFMDDDNDSVLYVKANGPNYDTLSEAQDFVRTNAMGMKTYLNPIKPNSIGITWLSELEEANKI